MLDAHILLTNCSLSSLVIVECGELIIKYPYVKLPYRWNEGNNTNSVFFFECRCSNITAANKNIRGSDLHRKLVGHGDQGKHSDASDKRSNIFRLTTRLRSRSFRLNSVDGSRPIIQQHHHHWTEETNWSRHQSSVIKMKKYFWPCLSNSHRDSSIGHIKSCCVLDNSCLVCRLLLMTLFILVVHTVW